MVRSIAGDISNAARILQDEELYLAYRRQSAGTTVKMLAPRRGIAFEVDAGPNEQFAQMPFSGVYHCENWSKNVPGAAPPRTPTEANGRQGDWRILLFWRHRNPKGEDNRDDARV